MGQSMMVVGTEQGGGRDRAWWWLGQSREAGWWLGQSRVVVGTEQGGGWDIFVAHRDRAWDVHQQQKRLALRH